MFQRLSRYRRQRLAFGLKRKSDIVENDWDQHFFEIVSTYYSSKTLKGEKMNLFLACNKGHHLAQAFASNTNLMRFGIFATSF